MSVSEDGTICVTDLKSEEIRHKVVSSVHKGGDGDFTNKRRTDQFMNDRNQNVRTQRRHSVTQFFSTEEYFKYERIQANEIFD